MKKIRIHVTKDGQITVQPSGFSGSECLKATEEIEKALGKPVDRDSTPEMYAAGLTMEQDQEQEQ